MDTDILMENKDCLYGDDFLDQLTNEYQWSSLLDATDASPSEILADAAPILVPPISPILSIKSSPPESSNSDSGSEDDSKNSSSTSDRQSSQSPLDWMSSFEDDPPSNLNLEDVEQFLQKTAPIINSQPIDQNLNKVLPERNGPVMAIENGVIKGVKMKSAAYDLQLKSDNSLRSNNHKENGFLQNAYFKVVNENQSTRENNKTMLSEQIRLVVEQKKIPSILKRPLLVNAKQTESVNGSRLTISPLQQSSPKTSVTNGYEIRFSPPRSNIATSPKRIMSAVSAPIVQNGVTSPVTMETPTSPTVHLTNSTDAEVRAIKKQQRMIKNRESASQSRQKKKDYVSALEQQLLEARQEIIRLKLENKLLRDQMETGGRSRKIPRFDASVLIPKKNIAVILAMVFMVSMNFNLGWNSKPFVGPAPTHRNTRQLLWAEEKPDNITPDNDQIVNGTYGPDCQNMTMKTSDFGKMNQTESIRIVGELNRWIGGGKTLNWTYDLSRKKRKVHLDEQKIYGGLLETYRLFNKLNLDSNLVDIPSPNKKNIKDKTRLHRLRKNKDIDFPESEVYDYEALYRKPMRKPVDEFDIGDFGEWNALLQALQRRDDTFYVVGVGKGEHLLLPAVSHNITRPPKMALILPARTGNDSLKSDHVTLMQIDCSVVNTTIVKLKSDALPKNLRKTPNDKPTKENMKPETKRSTYFRRPTVDSVDESLSDVLQSSSNNISNSPLKFKSVIAPSTEVEIGKDEFAQYLISKYKESKNGSKGHVINIPSNKSNNKQVGNSNKP